MNSFTTKVAGGRLDVGTRPDECQRRHVHLWKDPMRCRSQELRYRPSDCQAGWRRESPCTGRHNYCTDNWQLRSAIEGGSADAYPPGLCHYGCAAVGAVTLRCTAQHVLHFAWSDSAGLPSSPTCAEPALQSAVLLLL
jgi:hypothetical protein